MSNYFIVYTYVVRKVEAIHHGEKQLIKYNRFFFFSNNVVTCNVERDCTPLVFIER